MVIHSSDLQDKTYDVCRRLQEFLGLTYIENIPMPHSNAARAAKVRVIDDLIKHDSNAFRKFKFLLKRIFNVQSLGIRGFIESVNSVPIQHTVDETLRAEMRVYFRSDVVLLGKLLNQDFLKQWNWETDANAESPDRSAKVFAQ
jgi:hypothetical protein